MRRILAALAAALTISLVAVEARDWKADLEEALKATLGAAKTPRLGSGVSQPGTVYILRMDMVSQSSFMDNFARGQGTKMPDLKKGDRVYIYNVKVRNDTEVVFDLMTVETITIQQGGTTQATHNASGLMLRLKAPETLKTLTPQQVKERLEPFLIGETVSAAPKTISLGQTIAEVESILGKPETIINLGAKVTYVYKTMKVIFTDGKVTNVQ